jgi:hypothetical protein
MCGTALANLEDPENATAAYEQVGRTLYSYLTSLSPLFHIDQEKFVVVRSLSPFHFKATYVAPPKNICISQLMDNNITLLVGPVTADILIFYLLEIHCSAITPANREKWVLKLVS